MRSVTSVAVSGRPKARDTRLRTNCSTQASVGDVAPHGRNTRRFCVTAEYAALRAEIWYADTVLACTVSSGPSEKFANSAGAVSACVTSAGGRTPNTCVTTLTYC